MGKEEKGIPVLHKHNEKNNHYLLLSLWRGWGERASTPGMAFPLKRRVLTVSPMCVCVSVKEKNRIEKKKNRS